MRKLEIIIFLWVLSICSFAQENTTPVMAYEPVPDFFKLPADLNFGEVTGIAANSSGHIFIYHRGPHALVEFDAEGNYVRSLADGFFTKAHGLRIDQQDNIWTTDTGAHVVLKIDPQGHIKMVLGKRHKKGEWDDRYNIALFNQPTDVNIGTKGDIFVADGYGNSRIVKFDRNGRFIKAWGKRGTATSELNVVHNIVISPEGIIYVADRENSRIQIFDEDGNFIKAWTHVGPPSGLHLTDENYLYMTDAAKGRIVKLDLEGNILGMMGEPGKQPGQLGWPHWIFVNKNKEIFVTEINNWRAQKFVKKIVN